ncbi:MAG: hypothetical protein ACE5FU_14270 [Nitrospinota bacterium]
MKKYVTILIPIFLFPRTTLGSEPTLPGNQGNKIVIMREITVEGEFENPAFIIIPKAKLYKKELFKKSYYNDIVRDIYFQPLPKRKDVTVNKKRQ